MDRRAYSRERVESDGLETDHVVTTWNATGNCGGPTVVLSNHLPGTPLTVTNGSRQETRLVDLELLQN